jgi:TolB-like protein/DNA-binding winged helix-turn-helix (wHTH) protein
MQPAPTLDNGAAPPRFRIADLEVDIGTAEVRRGDEKIALPKLSFDLLCALIHAAPAIVTNDDLLQKVWPGLMVSPESVAQRVKLLRSAIGDDSQQPRYILGVRGRGYRLIPAVERVTESKLSTNNATNTQGAAIPGGPTPQISTLKRSPLRLKPAIIGAAAVVALSAAIALGLHFLTSSHGDTKAPAVAAITDKSIAVLPFVDMSEKQDQEYFADGTAEEILDLLAKIPDLHVPARTSSFYFKGKSEDIPTIARRLNVAHVLEGSVRKSGNQVRISVQLVRADNGYHVWSQTYDRTLDDIFKVQHEIAGEVVRVLKVSLGANEPPHGVTTQNPVAHGLVLQARFFMNRHGPGDQAKAVGYYQQAVQLVPDSAPAWAGLSKALTFGQLPMGGWQTERLLQEAREPALQAAERAIAIDANLAEGHEALALVRFYYDWDWAAVEAESEMARALDPAITYGLLEGNLAAVRGKLGDALALWEQAAVRDPLNTWVLGSLAYGYYSAGQFAEAEATARKSLELSPTGLSMHDLLAAILLAQGKQDAAFAEIEKESFASFRNFSLARAYAQLGRRAESLAAIALVEKCCASTQTYNIATVYAYLGEFDQAFSWLESAYQRHDSVLVGLPPITVDPEVKSLRGDPRYKALLRKMNLPE